MYLFFDLLSVLLNAVLICFIPPCVQSRIPLILPLVFYVEYPEWHAAFKEKLQCFMVCCGTEGTNTFI